MEIDGIQVKPNLITVGNTAKAGDLVMQDGKLRIMYAGAIEEDTGSLCIIFTQDRDVELGEYILGDNNPITSVSLKNIINKSLAEVPVVIFRTAVASPVEKIDVHRLCMDSMYRLIDYYNMHNTFPECWVSGCTSEYSLVELIWSEANDLPF